MDIQRIKKVLFYGFVVLLPFQTVYLLREVFIGGEKWQYGTVGIYFSDIFLFGAIGIAFIASQFFQKNHKSQITNFIPKPGSIYRTVEISLALLLLWTGLSILWASDQGVAGYFFVKLLLAAGVFCLARSLSEKESRVVVLLCIVGAALQGALGTWQFLTQSTFVSTWLGMSMHEVWQAGTSVLKLGDGRWLRAYGTLSHPNMLGGFLSAVFVMGIGYLLFFGGSVLRTVLMSCNVLRKSGASLRERFADTMRLSGIVIIGILMFLGLTLTFSRAAWLGAVLGIAVLAVYINFSQEIRKKRSSFRVTFLKIGGVLTLMGVVFGSILHDEISPRFDAATIEQEGSVSERIISLHDAKNIITDRPIIGVGAGNFTEDVIRREPNRPVWSIQPAHNVFILVLAELGIVGLFLFIAFLFSLLQSIMLNFSKSDTGKNNVFVFAFFALVPSLFLDHWLWTSHFGLLFFFLFIGFAVRRK